MCNGMVLSLGNCSSPFQIDRLRVDVSKTQKSHLTPRHQMAS